MPEYRYLVGDLNPTAPSNGLRDEIPFDTVRFSHVLNRPGGFSATLPLRHAKATRTNLDPGKTAVHIERDGVLVWSGILWTARANVEGAALDLGGEGWWSYFRRRLIRTTKTFTAADQFLIARTLINDAQAVGGGNVGIAVGTETSGVTRDRTYYHYERKNVGEAVEQLAGVDNGFDFAVDVAYVSGVITKTFRLHFPRRGRTTAIVLDLGTNIEGISQEVDATRQANQIDALGAGEGDAMLIATAADTSQLANYPLLEDVIALKDVSVVGTLQGHAALETAARVKPVMRMPTLLAHQASPDVGLGSFITGDIVTVRGSDGYLSVDEAMRIMEYSVSIDTDGREAVSLGMAQLEATL